VRSGVQNEALGATPLDSEYKAKRNTRATKVIQEYFKYNLSPEYKCKRENCKSGMNHCCSMCKIIRGINRNSVLKATVGERIDEFAVGVLFGGCALKPPINEETDMTALEKLIQIHKDHPPWKQDVDDFDMFAQPIPHDSCPDNMYQSSITRHALWEVRHERPDIIPEQLTTALLETIKDMLARDDNMLTKENLYIMRGDEALHASFLDMESGSVPVIGESAFADVTMLNPVQMLIDQCDPACKLDDILSSSEVVHVTDAIASAKQRFNPMQGSEGGDIMLREFSDMERAFQRGVLEKKIADLLEKYMVGTGC
jgi:hypothetical protein